MSRGTQVSYTEADHISRTGLSPSVAPLPKGLHYMFGFLLPGPLAAGPSTTLQPRGGNACKLDIPTV